MAMDFKENLNKLMQTAKEMQEKMQKLQKEVESSEETGTSGGGMVSVTLNGRYFAKKIQITNELLEEDKKTIEDLILAAMNSAVEKISKKSEASLKELAAGLNVEGAAKDDE